MLAAMNSDFACEFCSRKFVKESSLIAHCCAKKMRWLDKDNKNVVLGLIAYKRFYQLTSPSMTKAKSYKEMVDSQYYNAFVSFGKWLNDAYVVNPTAYIDYVIKGNVKLKDWQKESIYQQYLKAMIFKEHPCEALERSITWLQKWSEDTKYSIESFYQEIGTNKLVDILRSGKISPWLIYLSPNRDTILRMFDESQYKLLNNLLDPHAWNLKLRRCKADIEEYKGLIRDLGL